MHEIKRIIARIERSLSPLIKASPGAKFLPENYFYAHVNKLNLFPISSSFRNFVTSLPRMDCSQLPWFSR